MALETFLQRTGTGMATGGDRRQRQGQMRFLLHDLHCGANRARGNGLSVVSESFSMRVISGEQESTNQAVDERQSDERLVEQAVRPQKLLREQHQHVGPALGRRGGDWHDGREVDLRRHLATDRIAKRIIYGTTVQSQGYHPGARCPMARGVTLRRQHGGRAAPSRYWATSMDRDRTSRLRQKYSIGVAQLTAFDRDFRSDEEFGDGDRTEATDPLGKRERIRIADELEIRLSAADDGKVVECLRFRPSTPLRGIGCRLRARNVSHGRG